MFWGGCVIALGHYTLVIPNQQTFYLGLVLIAIGTGLLKPNVSALVGDLYADKGAKRDAGFSIYYMGINIGAFAGPLVCSYLGEELDWHLGFGAAGVGMTLAVIQFVFGRPHLEGCGELPAESGTPDKVSQAKRMLGIGVAAVLGLIGVLYLLNASGAASITAQTIAANTSYVVSGVSLVYFGSVVLFVCKNGVERQQVVLIALLFLGAACFWSGFEQAFTVMNIFAEEHTDRVVLGWEMPTGWLQSVNPLFIILLAPVVGMLWQRLGERSPTLGVKFGSGLILLGVGFVVMLWGAQSIDAGKVGMHYLVVCYFFHTVGELVLSPVGLSAVTKLSPEPAGQPDDGHLVHGLGARQPDRGTGRRGPRGEPPERDLPQCGTVLRRRRRRVPDLVALDEEALRRDPLTTAKLYPAHVAARQKQAEAALAAAGYDALLLSSGTPFTYYADDMHAPHHENAALRARGCRSRGRTTCCSCARERARSSCASRPRTSGTSRRRSASRSGARPSSSRSSAPRKKSGSAPPPPAAWPTSAMRPRRPARRAPTPIRRRCWRELDWNRSYKTPYEVACVEEADARGRARPPRRRARPSRAAPRSSRSTTSTSRPLGVRRPRAALRQHRGPRPARRDAALRQEAPRAQRPRAPDRRRRARQRLRRGHHAHLDHAGLRRDLPRAGRGRRRAAAGALRRPCARGSPTPSCTTAATSPSARCCTTSVCSPSAARTPSSAA